jgi:hypothetical protein
VYEAPKTISRKFVRIANFHPDRPNEVLIEYVGDESVAGQFSHGNSAQPHGQPFSRTMPHVLTDIRSTSGAPQAIYRQLVTSADSNTPDTAVPRNPEQVRNSVKTEKNRGRLSRDAIYNVHELAYDSNFIQQIHTFPDLSIIMYDPEVLATFRRVIRLPGVQQLTYDTTFTLGDFYLSVVLFRESEFVSAPVVPLAYLLHERKHAATHDEFFRHMAAVCPEIETADNVIFVTDNEKAIRSAIGKNFPSRKIFLCWNHILQVSFHVRNIIIIIIIIIIINNNNMNLTTLFIVLSSYIRCSSRDHAMTHATVPGDRRPD